MEITEQMMKSAIGGHFTTTGGGNTSDNESKTFPTGEVVCHFTFKPDNPGAVHLSIYPTDDIDFRRKILHYEVFWKNDSNQFGPLSLKLGTWKPYKNDFTAIKQFAERKIGSLEARLKENVKKATPAPTSVPAPTSGGAGGGAGAATSASKDSLGSRFVSGGTMVPRSDGMGYETALKK